MNSSGFLQRFEEIEQETGLEDEFVIIRLKDWEVTRSAISFGRVKIVNGHLVSNTSFRFEINDVVIIAPTKPNELLTCYSIVGRIHWKGFENDYMLDDGSGNKDIKQVPESKLIKKR